MALNKQFTMEQLFIAITVSRLVLTVGLVLSIGGSFVWSGHMPLPDNKTNPIAPVMRLPSLCS